MAFKMSLRKVLEDASLAKLDGYQVEEVYYSAEEVTVDLADEQQRTFPNQDIEVDEFGAATATDENGDIVNFEFEATIPYKPAHLLARPRVVILLGDDGELPQVVADSEIVVLVLQQGQDVNDHDREERYFIRARTDIGEAVTVAGEPQVLAPGQEDAAWVHQVFGFEAENRETFHVKLWAVGEDGEGEEAYVGECTATNCPTTKEAEAFAMETLWDARLDTASCVPRFEVQRNPRWVDAASTLQGV
ncbi:hypothetical protein [Ottowia sp.]|uniref:hypothetical protein n=1 Tax=Ottowia sp. TaxID=1898956 RepID=UPI0025F13D64|nr:hypothetical protein [Ottowia sp.]MBK6616460.1 hypothetical protein [Ottowia sp.]